jgi:hypothetical protein
VAVIAHVNSSPRGPGRATLDLPAFAALLVLEACVVILAMGMYKKGDRSLDVFVASRAGAACVVALAGIVVALVVIVVRYRLEVANRGRGVRLALALNLMFVAAALATLEGMVRMASVRSSGDTTFMGMRLLPRDWNEVAAHYQAEASREGSYLVFEPVLGWDVGPSRASANGLYFSSVEGLRSARPGERFAGPTSQLRVALVGDSFTFGQEVTYEDSWGYQLQRGLGEGVQVLNFGVDAYGVDQAYLKYRHRVRDWRPDLVIFGLIDHDLDRMLSLYHFLTFPGFAHPFPKPRMVVDDRGLRTLNVPLSQPQEIFSAPSIGQVPFIGFEYGYHPWEWEWHYHHNSYLVRFFQSRFPRYPLPRPEAEDEIRRLGVELLHSFIRIAHADRTIPVIVFFPSRTRFEESAFPWPSAPAVLRAAGIAYLDMTDCVARVAPRDRFLVRHYSPVANAVIARCLRDAVRTHLRISVIVTSQIARS